MQSDPKESRQEIDERQVTTFSRVVLVLLVAAILAFVLYCFSIPHARYVLVVCFCFEYVFAPALAWLSLTASLRYRLKRFLVYTVLAGTLAILLFIIPLIAIEHHREFETSWFRNPFYFPASGPDS